MVQMSLEHGCARVAHFVIARWRNFSHYCRPLRHYDVWLRVLIIEKHWQPRRQYTLYRNKRLGFATEQVGKLRYVTAVDGGLKRFPWVAWFAHPWSRNYNHLNHSTSTAIRIRNIDLKMIAWQLKLVVILQHTTWLDVLLHFNVLTIWNCII